METEKGNFEKFKNSIVLKDVLTLEVIFSSTPRKQSKRINETELTRWFQSKDPWKSVWIQHFN